MSIASLRNNHFIDRKKYLAVFTDVYGQYIDYIDIYLCCEKSAITDGADIELFTFIFERICLGPLPNQNIEGS